MVETSRFIGAELTLKYFLPTTYGMIKHCKNAENRAIQYI